MTCFSCFPCPEKQPPARGTKHARAAEPKGKARACFFKIELRPEMQQAQNRRAQGGWARTCRKRRHVGGGVSFQMSGIGEAVWSVLLIHKSEKFSKNKKYQNERNNYTSELRSRPRGWRGKFPVSYSSRNLKIHKS